MRKHRILFTLLFCLVIVLAGCNSTSRISDGILASKPKWVDNPEVKSRGSKIAFSGTGVSENARQAELLAYRNLRDSVQEYIGTELGQNYYRELTTEGTMKDFSISVQSIYRENREGEFFVSILATANKDVLLDKMDDSRKGLNDVILKVESLVNSGNNYIRQGKDVEALNCYIESLQYSKGIDNLLPRFFRYDYVLDHIINILNSFSISIVEADEDNASCVLSVRKRETVLPSYSIGCKVKAYFTATGSTDKEYNDSFVCITDSKGKYVFEPTNFSMKKSGTVLFKLDIEEQVRMLEKKDPEASARILQVLDEKTVLFEFDRQMKLDGAGIAGLFYKKGGVYYNKMTIVDNMVERFADESLGCMPISVLKDEEDSEILAKYTGNGLVVILRCCITDIIKTDTTTVCTVAEATIDVYDSSTSELSYSSGILSVVGFGKTADESENNCCNKFTDLAYTLIKGAYVQ